MGIDWAPKGSNVNRDEKTGIRYGIVPMHRLCDFAFEEFESEYDPFCPACGDELPEDFDTYGDDPRCPHCEIDLRGSESIYGDEPSRQTLNRDGYEGMLDSSMDVWVFKSPYYTIAGFASPCAPGAVYLLTAVQDAKAYCLGHDWYEDGRAPYRVFSVETDEEIMPEVSGAER